MHLLIYLHRRMSHIICLLLTCLHQVHRIVMFSAVACAVLVCAIVQPHSTFAQAGSLDPSFTTSVGADNGSVRWILKLSGGDYLVAGDFSSYGGAARGGIARITSSGALVGSFAPAGVGAGTGILSMGQRSDGNVYIGGNFTTYNGTTVNGIALIDPSNGNLITGFTTNAGTGLTTIAPGPAGVGEVFTIAVQADDKVVIGGTFELYNGIPRVSIARVNTDGTLDLTFTPGDGPFDPANGDGMCCDAGGVYPGVRNIKLDGTGKMYVSGFFTGFQPGAAPFYYDRRYLMRLNSDGSMDAAFDPTPATPNDNAFFSGGSSVWPIAFDGTKIVVGGNFTTFNVDNTTTVTRNQIARLNNDGTLDAAFNPANGVNGTEIQSISLMANGTYLIGGTFTNYYTVGTNRNRIARINPDGTLDVNFNPGTGANQTIFFILPDGDFAVIGGLFTDYNGTTVSRIARVRNATAPTAFTSSAPPNAMVGVPYSFNFIANGSPAPSYALFSGVLPVGTALASSGALTGTPTIPVVYNFTLRASNGGGDFDQAFAITVNQRSLSYSAAGFAETMTNNGSINNTTPLTITLSADTFSGTNGDDFVAAGKIVITNLPAGLTAVATRTSATQIAVTLTGTATAHANANDINNLTFTFQNSAFTNGAAAFVTTAVKNDLVVDFLDPFTATYSATTFAEDVANNGSITQIRTITLNGGETWTSSVANGATFTDPTHFSVVSVPAGLTMVITKVSATQVSVSFTGNAAAHAAANSVTGVQITFTAAALANASPASVSSLNGTNLSLNFGDGTAVYSATDFPEAAANNGTITQTRTITLTGDTWSSAITNGTDLTNTVHYTVVNVPSGLTLKLTKNSATQVTIAFTGSASAHAAANSITNVQVTYLAAALTGLNPAVIAGLNGTNLSVTFNDPAPIPPTGFTAQTPPTVLTVGQSFSYTFAANGTPAPSYAVASGALPPGLSLNAVTGVLSGTASGVGTFGPIVVQASNGGGSLNSIAFTISVLPPAVQAITPTPPLRFTLGAAATLSASIGVPYSLTLIADGTPDPRYSVVSGVLPRGLSLSSVGVISGTPLELGASKFTVEARNVAGAITIDITLIVGPPRPFVTAISQEDVTFGSEVVIRGYNLSAATSVYFGGVGAFAFRIDNDNQITAVVGNGGSGTVVVNAPLGSSTAPSVVRYTPPAKPEITGFVTDTIPSGDSDYTLIVQGRNLSPIATYLVSPVTNTSASFNTAIPTVVLRATSTIATLRVPLATRTLGIKLLTIQIASESASSTFAVVRGPAPMLISQTVPSTVASSQAFTTFITGRNLFRRGFAAISVNGDITNSEVIDSVTARVEIPASMNVVGSRITIRLTNYDGQFAEIPLNIVSRIAPFISSVRSVLRGNRMFFIITGTGFFGTPIVRIQNIQVAVTKITPAELEVEIPSNFPRPSLTEEAWVLVVENPDTQRYGYRVVPATFYPSPSAFTLTKEFTTTQNNLAASAVSNVAQSLGNEMIRNSELRIAPNPASDMVRIELPYTTQRRLLNKARVRLIDTRGVVVQEMIFDCSESELLLSVNMLASGMYLLEVQAGSEVQRGRFVKW